MEVENYSKTSIINLGQFSKPKDVNTQHGKLSLYDEQRKTQYKVQNEQSNKGDDPQITNKKKQIKMMADFVNCKSARMYTKKSWCNLANAIAKALAVANSKNPTMKQLDKVIKLLYAGMAKLEYVEEDSDDKRGNANEMRNAYLKSMHNIYGEKDEDVSVILGSVPIKTPTITTTDIVVDVNV